MLQVLRLEAGGGGGTGVEGVGAVDAVIRVEHGRHMMALRVGEDVQLQLVDEDEDQQGAKHAALRHAVLHPLPR